MQLYYSPSERITFYICDWPIEHWKHEERFVERMHRANNDLLTALSGAWIKTQWVIKQKFIDSGNYGNMTVYYVEDVDHYPVGGATILSDLWTMDKWLNGKLINRETVETFKHKKSMQPEDFKDMLILTKDNVLTYIPKYSPDSTYNALFVAESINYEILNFATLLNCKPSEISTDVGTQARSSRYKDTRYYYKTNVTTEQLDKIPNVDCMTNFTQMEWICDKDKIK